MASTASVKTGLQRSERPEIITDEDRLRHTAIYLERAFGVPVDNLGAVELVDGRAVLSFQHDGTQHTLAWRRTSSGAIMWYLDGSDKPIALGDQIRAQDRLIEAIEGKR
jgi:hypothetical protein